MNQPNNNHPAPVEQKEPALASKDDAKEMSILEHLAELRKRLLVSFFAVLVGSVVAYCFSGEIFKLLSEPFDLSFKGADLIGTSPAEAFLLKIKLACFAGLILSSPIIFWQIWIFCAPGLHQHERRLAIPFLVSSTLLFLIGILFAYYAMLPIAYGFFYDQYVSLDVAPQIKIGEHLSFVVQALLAFGVMFELPILAFFLGRIGIINHRMLISGSRYAIVIILIISAILTPPDVLSQLLMAIPLMLLYAISILVVKYLGKRKPKE